ncbi:hypothetical protein LBMAG16_06200 [Actinomycetes bacterium]|nr:hypothetical protein LBMAG16_06200 [Actinomycetes bacterium]
MTLTAYFISKSSCSAHRRHEIIALTQEVGTEPENGLTNKTFSDWFDKTIFKNFAITLLRRPIGVEFLMTDGAPEIKIPVGPNAISARSVANRFAGNF